MKIINICLVLIVSFNAQAEEDPSLINQMAKSAAESFLRGQITGQITNGLDQVLTPPAFPGGPLPPQSHLVSNAFAVYGIAKGVDGYQKAKDEQSRYFAAASVIAAGVSLYCAPVGAAMQLSLMGQSLVAGYIGKQGLKDALRIIKEAAEIDLRTLTSIERRQRADYAFRHEIEIREKAAADLSEKTKTQIGTDCTKPEAMSDFDHLMVCVHLTRQVAFLDELQANLMTRLFSDQSELFSVEKFEIENKLKKGSIAELIKTLHENSTLALKNLVKAEVVYQEIAFAYGEAKMEEKLEVRRRVLQCLSDARLKITPIVVTAKSFDRTDEFEALILKQQLTEAGEVFHAECEDLPAEAVPENTRMFLVKLSKALKAASE